MIRRLAALSLLLAVPAGADEGPLAAHKRDVNAVAVSADGTLIASGGSDSEVKVWSGGKEIASRPSDQGAVQAVAFSPDGKMVAAGSMYGDITLWDRTAGKDVYSKRGQEGRVTGIAFLPDGKSFVSAGVDQKVRVWDTASGKEKATLAGHKFSIGGLAVGRDGRIFTSDSGGFIRVWDGAKLKEAATYELQKGADAHAVAVSADGKTLAVGYADGTVVFADGAGKELRRLKLADSVNSLAFSPDGKRLAAGTQNEELFVVDVDAGKQAASLKGHGRPITSVAYTPDGKKIVSGSMDMTVRVWNAN